MKTTSSFASIILALLIFTSCASNKKQDAEIGQTTQTCNKDSVKVDSLEKDTIKADTAATTIKKDASTEVAAKSETPSSPFSKVTKWEIKLVSLTTHLVEITKEEADCIEAGKDSKYDKYFEDEEAFVNEVDGKYFITYHANVEIGKKTVTKPDIVAKLNKMMADKKYSDYRNNTTVKGNTAIAEWYDGNRGGGIEEDFPADIKNAIFD